MLVRQTWLVCTKVEKFWKDPVIRTSIPDSLSLLYSCYKYIANHVGHRAIRARACKST